MQLHAQLRNQSIVTKMYGWLPRPEYDQVPRGSAKASLVENGLYIDAFKLEKTWSEAILCSELAALFENVMKLRGQHAIP